MPNFETSIDRLLRLFRREHSDEPHSPSELADGPYVQIVGRASEDGSSGSVQVASGESQRVLVDELGRIWTRIFGTVNTSPVSAKGKRIDLVGASGSFVGLPTTAYALSSIITLGDARSITLYVAYESSATGGQFSLVPLVSGHDTAPASTADSWFALGVTPGTFSSTLALPRPLPLGMALTTNPPWGQFLYRGLDIRPPAATGAGQRIRFALNFDVSGAKFMEFLYAEVSPNPGKFWLSYVLHT
jgi:hypothetical protein